MAPATETRKNCSVGKSCAEPPRAPAPRQHVPEPLFTMSRLASHVWRQWGVIRAAAAVPKTCSWQAALNDPLGELVSQPASMHAVECIPSRVLTHTLLQARGT